MSSFVWFDLICFNNPLQIGSTVHLYIYNIYIRLKKLCRVIKKKCVCVGRGNYYNNHYKYGVMKNTNGSLQTDG